MPFERIQSLANHPIIKRLSALGTLSNAWAGLFAVLSGLGVLWAWGSTSMLAPMVAILTGLVAFLTLRVLLDPELGPKTVTLLKSRLGIRGEPSSPSPAAVTHPPYQPPHNPHLPVWLGMRDVLTDCDKRVREIVEEQRALTSHMQAKYEALAASSEVSDLAFELERDWSQWHSNAIEVAALFENAFAEPDAIGMRTYSPSATPFELESKLSDVMARKYHRFRDHVNLWEAKSPSLLGKLSKELAVYHDAISGEMRRLVVDAKRSGK